MRIVSIGLAVLLAGTAQAQDNRPIITVGVQQIATSGTLDVLREQSNVGARVVYSVVEPLIDNMRQDVALPQKPALATAWRRLDERTIELKLRPGVLFHNGETMTAEDVAFTFSPMRWRGEGIPDDATPANTNYPPREAVANARSLWPNLGDVQIIDTQTVRITSRVPDATMEGRIARYGSDIISKKGWEAAANWLAYARRPIGTGPYKIVDFRNDNMLVLEAHDAYWGGRPPIRTLRFVVAPDVSARVNGLLTGLFDFVTDLPPDQITVVQANPKFEVVGGPITNHRILSFDRNHPVLKDPRIRQALTHAIDRQLIVDTLFLGRTQVPKGLQWDYYGPMLIADWTVPQYDPARAKQLLAEAGYKGEPIPYRVLNNYYNNQVPTAQVLLEMWRAVGLNVQMEMKENWGQIMERNATRGIRDWSNSAPFNDPVASIVNQHCPRGGQQTSGEYTNADFNTLCGVLETSVVPAERRTTFARMLQIAEREDPAYTVLHQTTLLYGKRRDIRWTWSALQSMDFRAENFRISQ